MSASYTKSTLFLLGLYFIFAYWLVFDLGFNFFVVLLDAAEDDKYSESVIGSLALDFDCPSHQHRVDTLEKEPQK